MATDTAVFKTLEPGGKERLTLRLAPSVKAELKRQAALMGLSPSAYVTGIVMERKDRMTDE